MVRIDPHGGSRPQRRGKGAGAPEPAEPTTSGRRTARTPGGLPTVPSAPPTPSQMARRAASERRVEPAPVAEPAPVDLEAPAPVRQPEPVESAAPAVEHRPTVPAPVADPQTERRSAQPAPVRTIPPVRPVAPSAGASVRPSTPDGTPLVGRSDRTTWRHLPGRRGIGWLSVVALVGIELVVVGALLAKVVPSTVALACGMVVAVVGLLLLVPREGVSLGGWLLRRLRLVATPRVRRAPDAAGGVAALACFPDLVVQQVRTPREVTFGAARWSGTVVAALALGEHPDAGRVAGAHQVPVGHIRERLLATGIDLESIAVVERTDGAERVRVLALRLRPEDAAGAVEARGGGERGILATVSTAVAVAQAQLYESGIPAHPLDRDGLQAELLAQVDPAPGAQGANAWQGTWTGVVGPHLSHRVLVARAVDGGADLSMLRSGARQRVVLEAGSGERGPEHPVVRLLVRVLDESPAALTAASAALRSVQGVDLVPVVDDTLDALAATTLLGSGLRRPDRAARAAGGTLDTWLRADPADLDRAL